jgi:hypothetical protein
VAQGSKDFEVDPDKDALALVRAAKRAKLAVEFKRYDDLDHHFKPEPERSSPERYLSSDRQVDPGFVADLVAWSKGVAGRRN